MNSAFCRYIHVADTDSTSQLGNEFTTSGPNLLQRNPAANILKGLQDTQKAALDRWWEFAFQPPTPSPANLKYECNVTLRSPSSGNCEAALYQLILSGFITFDPANGPTIVFSGMLSVQVVSFKAMKTFND